ncbi:MAG TPA: CsbD family protein [Dehalococcoidia bacterium]|nr:CsbD family protein [Dehalococcoidia bacterium]
MRGQESDTQRLKTQERWEQVSGRIKSVWGNITDDDIKASEGNIQALIGKIKERTGESIETINDRLREIIAEEEIPEDRQKKGE